MVNHGLLRDDRWRVETHGVTISDSGGKGSVISEAGAEKSGSYRLDRALRAEESVRKNKGGPWRMVGDGATVVYRRPELIINPG